MNASGLPEFIAFFRIVTNFLYNSRFNHVVIFNSSVSE